MSLGGSSGEPREAVGGDVARTAREAADRLGLAGWVLAATWSVALAAALVLGLGAALGGSARACEACRDLTSALSLTSLSLLPSGTPGREPAGEGPALTGPRPLGELLDARGEVLP